MLTPQTLALGTAGGKLSGDDSAGLGNVVALAAGLSDTGEKATFGHVQAMWAVYCARIKATIYHLMNRRSKPTRRRFLLNTGIVAAGWELSCADVVLTQELAPTPCALLEEQRHVEAERLRGLEIGGRKTVTVKACAVEEARQKSHSRQWRPAVRAASFYTHALS
jgi:hypothetical protein